MNLMKWQKEKEEWKQILREFYPPFEKELEKVDKELEHVKLEDEVSGC